MDLKKTVKVANRPKITEEMREVRISFFLRKERSDQNDRDDKRGRSSRHGPPSDRNEEEAGGGAAASDRRPAPAASADNRKQWGSVH